MFKYCFYTLLLCLWMACGSETRGTPTPPLPPNNTNVNQQPGQCFLNLMEVSHSPIYEIFLSETPQSICGKSGGRWFVNKQIYAGSSACKNWTASPTVEITFDLQFTKIQKLQITPRGSGGFFAGNYGAPAAPIVLRANVLISAQNKDKGWNAVIHPANTLSGGALELYCRNCDFNKNREMSIQLEYRGQKMGILRINPKTTARCPAAGASPHAQPVI